ncbi:hypothetical protein [Sinomonas albida]|uniref:hypothetical protein n=1 Tax=Sinomonas albida TaxID=369942 RepID=UPI0010A77164|nr:hypothetical protein [Sinomonas albida]
MADGNELTKAIFIMAASPITPSRVRSFLVHSEDEPPEEKAQLLEEAVRVLPPGTFERYSEVERSQITVGLSEAELLGF